MIDMCKYDDIEALDTSIEGSRRRDALPINKEFYGALGEWGFELVTGKS